MRHFILAFAAASGLATAQDGFAVELAPRSRICRGGHDIELRLTVTVEKDTVVPVQLLSGMALECRVDGKPGPKIEERVSGTVKVAGKTRIERAVTVSADRLPNARSDGLTEVTFAWSGVAGAEAVIQLAPDMSAVEIDDLDLEATRVLLVTNYGEMRVRFLPDKAPNHVRNFIKLAKDGFYDGTRFHRIIKKFMIQGGCPNTKDGARGMPGTGNPGYTIDAEFNDTRHVKGVLSMARSQNPNSAGCQFFIVHGEAPHLDGNYTAFGMLDAGMDTLDRIADVQVRMSGGGEASEPVEPVHLYAAVVLPVRQKK